MITKLKSTGQELHIINYIGRGTKPWGDKYERVLIPNDNGKNHIQIVKKENIIHTMAQ